MIPRRPRKDFLMWRLSQLGNCKLPHTYECHHPPLLNENIRASVLSKRRPLISLSSATLSGVSSI